MSKSILELKRNKAYIDAITNITGSRYGLESKFFDVRNKNRIGLEDIEDELNANDEEIENETFAPEETAIQPAGATGGDIGVGDDMDDSSVVDNMGWDNPDPAVADYDENGYVPPSEPEETTEKTIANMDKDGVSDSYTIPDTDVDWEETQMDDLKSNADCVNMLKIIGNYTNEYTENYQKLLVTNKDVIETTGDFKANILFNDFINPAMTILEQVYNESPSIKHIRGLIDLMMEKRKMISIAGKPDTPFIYEGMQLVLLETIRTMLALIPSTIKQNQSLEEVMSSMNLNVPKCLIQMCADLIELSPLYGSKIYFVEPVVSEITHKSEELANTPYTDLDVFNNPSMKGNTPAGESIMNLVEIKNNNALLEFSALNKMMSVITGLLDGQEIAANCKAMLTKIANLMACPTEQTDEVLADCLVFCRDEVILPQVQKMAELAVKENEKMTEDPDTSNVVPTEVTPKQIPILPPDGTEEIPEDGGVDKISEDTTPEDEDLDEF